MADHEGTFLSLLFCFILVSFCTRSYVKAGANLKVLYNLLLCRIAMPSHYNIFQNTFDKGITVQAFRDDRTIVYTCMRAWEKHTVQVRKILTSFSWAILVIKLQCWCIHSRILLLSPALLCHVHPKLGVEPRKRHKDRDGRLEPPSNHLIGVSMPGSLIDQREGSN